MKIKMFDINILIPVIRRDIALSVVRHHPSIHQLLFIQIFYFIQKLTLL